MLLTVVVLLRSAVDRSGACVILIHSDIGSHPPSRLTARYIKYLPISQFASSLLPEIQHIRLTVVACVIIVTILVRMMMMTIAMRIMTMVNVIYLSVLMNSVRCVKRTVRDEERKTKKRKRS